MTVLYGLSYSHGLHAVGSQVGQLEFFLPVLLVISLINEPLDIVIIIRAIPIFLIHP